MLYIIEDISQLDDKFVFESYNLICSNFNSYNIKSKESMCSRILLHYILKEKLRFDKYEAVFEKNKKPYLVNNGVYFNISHSGNSVACAVSQNEIGCDIQAKTEFNEKIAKRYFCQSEYDLLQLTKDKSAIFFKLWTLKESVLKFSGEGISGGLATYDFSSCVYKDEFQLYNLNFKILIFNNIFAAVCSERKNCDVTFVTCEQLLQYYQKMKGEQN